MNYPQRNRLKGSHFKKIIILIALLLFGATTFSVFDSLLIPVFSSLWKAENVLSANLRNGTNFFQTQKSLVEENTVLRERVTSLEMENLSLYADRDQKNELLELFGQRQIDDLVLASVLVHPPRAPYDTIIIDIGSENGISVGSKVYLKEGPIVGVVSEVFSKQARVNLFSTNGQETSGVMERSGLPVTLVGSGGGNFKISIPRDALVEEGDRVLSSETSSTMLAVVGDISLNSTDSFKDVLAKTPANIFNLRFVLVKP